MLDAVIIGGGVCGCAIARELSRKKGKFLVVEKEEDVCCGTSKANSGIVHAGFDAKHGTLMAKLNCLGSRKMPRLCRELDIPFRQNGSLVVMVDPQDRPRLQALYENGLANGVPGLEILGNTVSAAVSLYFLKKLQIKIIWGGLRSCVADFVNSSIYFLSNFATTFFSAFTTIVVGILMQKSDVAYWSLCVQIVAIAKAMYVPVANSLYPHMVKNRDLAVVRRISVLFTIPLFLGSLLVIVCGPWLSGVFFGKNYIYVGYILRFLLPEICFSFFSMLYGWPVLGAIGKIKETTFSTILSALVQVAGIGLLIGMGWFNLISLAFCCGISEGVLLGIRLAIFQKNRALFHKADHMGLVSAGNG